MSSNKQGGGKRNRNRRKNQGGGQQNQNQGGGKGKGGKQSNQQQKGGKGKGKGKQQQNQGGGGGGKKSSKAQQQPKRQQQRKQKEKVSSSDGRRRRGKGSTKGGQTKGKQIDIAQARLELIIRSKYQNPGKGQPTPLESKICQLLVDLEASSRDLKPHLRDLGIVSARKINITQTKKAIVIFVPKLQHQKWQKLQDRLVRELEKKFSDEDVLFIAQRKVMKLCVCLYYILCIMYYVLSFLLSICK